MKINPINLRALQTYNQTTSVKKSEKKSETFADKLEISSKAKEMHVSNAFESDRAEKVSQLKQSIDSGEYKVDARKVAQDMLKYYRR